MEDETQQSERDEVGEGIRSLFESFLLTYVRRDPRDASQGVSSARTVPTYMEKIARMREEDRTTLYVDFKDLVAHDPGLAELIQGHYYRFEPFLRQALHEAAKQQLIQSEGAAVELEENTLWLGFYNLGTVLKLRDIRSSRIGQLCCVSATVTRTSEVRPELIRGTFQCMDCLTDFPDLEQQFKYTEPQRCKNPLCENGKRWLLRVEKSHFTDWQKCHVQENSREIPSGSMPRTLEVILRNEDVEQARAGDRCLFTGTVIVVPDVSKLSVVHGVTAHKSAGGLTAENETGGVSGLKDLGSAVKKYIFISQ